MDDIVVNTENIFLSLAQYIIRSYWKKLVTNVYELRITLRILKIK